MFTRATTRRLAMAIAAAALFAAGCGAAGDDDQGADGVSTTAAPVADTAADTTTPVTTTAPASTAPATTAPATTAAPTTTVPPTTTIVTDPPTSTAAIENCQFPAAAFTNVGFGVPRTDVLVPSVGTVRVATMFVDFDDAPATDTPESVLELMNPLVPEWYDAMSYGRVTIEFDPHFEWLRLSQPSTVYGEAIRTGDAHRAFIQEAVDLADDALDFSGADVVLVLSNPDAAGVPYGPVFGSTNPGWGIEADGRIFTAGITSGADLTNWGGEWLVHEMGHAMSLPDLYEYGPGWPDLHLAAGGWSAMGRIDGHGPEFFALERWQLGWIDDDQVICHVDGEITVEIDAVESPGGAKAVVVPISADGLGSGRTEAVVIESRRKIGYDARIPEEGALVMVADSGVRSGEKPLYVTPGADNSTYRTDAPLQPGESYTYGPVTITVEGRTDTSDIITVTVTR